MSDVAYSLLPALTIHNDIVIACNDVFTEQVGYVKSEIIGCKLHSVLSILDAKTQHTISNEQLTAYVVDSAQRKSVKAALKNKHHYSLPVDMQCLASKDEVNVFELYFRVLENKSVDPITGLPNGWAIRSRAEYLLRLPERHKPKLALLIFSVDNFSTMNFRYGFDVGDNYLWVLGKTLQESINDRGLVVRYSNAKFGVLVEDYNGLSAESFDAYVVHICKHLCDVAAMPLKLNGGHQVNKSFSIGVSAESAVYDSYHAMEVAAEIAMREAKKFSTSKYCLATEQTKDDLVFKKLIIEELPQAIEQNQIKIYFQPQYDLSNGMLIGFEALSRWQHTELGNIPPDIFVGIAEEIGLHFEFDLWVFHQVCSQIVEWRKHGVNTPRIAINISFKTIEMTTFVSRIVNIIKTTQCPTELIEIEITETATAKNISTLRDNITQLKSAGINIAVDDFGTGYSSLNLIRTFCQSLDKLKLDRTLIENICNTELDREFTRQIIELSRVLQVKVLAEGVETREQRELLTQLGCDCAQGYYFDKALPVSETQALIDRAYSSIS
ncbi:putative bifunctional diguanylate cyclase/phosphodiesterase [Photobacterium alginatilyticum]|uniref:Bifunctional diguanylate cyclase/phosphodiesterase n=1 Tax=Photobacterium alginatilyticum TaxID=1775171 RepID=A0ABW9YPN6_9GAMM|nr:bifunctional diguanylate cyclase/phosphodiesterase [Photobacterium alginatilyticum]NBI55685.1 bifunctional diguanylate cyclase/phosphodiesterase [Photobacterium alginatilyticum]